MNGNSGDTENTDKDQVDDDLDVVEDPTETVVIDTEDDDNVGDMSVEINVEELVAKIEADDDGKAEEKRQIKSRLDELSDKKMTEEELGSTYTFDLDEDV